MKDGSIILIFLSLIFIKCSSETGEKSFVTKKVFHENGNLKSIYFMDTISSGRGISYHFYKNGLKSGEVPYKGKKIDGVARVYYNGELTLEELFVNGRKNGYYKNYHEGKIFEEGEYMDDLEHGVWNYYHENKLILSELYNKGELKEIIYKDTMQINRRGKKVSPIN